MLLISEDIWWHIEYYPLNNVVFSTTHCFPRPHVCHRLHKSFDNSIGCEWMCSRKVSSLRIYRLLPFINVEGSLLRVIFYSLHNALKCRVVTWFFSGSSVKFFSFFQSSSKNGCQDEMLVNEWLNPLIDCRTWIRINNLINLTFIIKWHKWMENVFISDLYVFLRLI
jgi:hypothetical protein